MGGPGTTCLGVCHGRTADMDFSSALGFPQNHFKKGTLNKHDLCWASSLFDQAVANFSLP